MATFRRLPLPGAVVSADRVAHAVTDFLAAQIGAPVCELEGLGLRDLFEGEVLDIADRVREQGGFSGYLASVEACVRLDISRHVRQGLSFNAHLLNWPHFCESGEIVRINQGIFLSDDQAAQVRERLAGAVRFHRLD